MDDVEIDIDNDYTLYYDRLGEVFEYVMATYTTEQWGDYLLERTPEEWCLEISKHTVSEFKDLLNQEKPPTLAQLYSLSWTDTKRAGVYGHIIRPLIDNHHNHLYVGCASSSQGGMKRRRSEHERAFSQDDRLKMVYHYNLMRQDNVPRVGHFFDMVIIKDVDLEDSDKDDILMSRKIVCIADAIYTGWLSAYTSWAPEELRFPTSNLLPPTCLAFPVGTIYNATVTGPVCPQPFAGGFAYQSNATDQSEDCLRLKIARPADVTAGEKLPVMVYVYGGGLFNGHINERTTAPDGLILEFVVNGLPVIYVAMNYRLNIFGFALSEALRSNNSLNARLRDQRLALEWVQQNIQHLGGDANRATIFGQSSGALSVTAIMQSTVLEPTMTSNLTFDTFNAVATLANCTDSKNPDPQSLETLQCLRNLPMEALLDITLTQQDSTSSQNDGDTYLPVIDGDFLPVLVLQLMQDDATLFTPSTIQAEAGTIAFLNLYYPKFTNATIQNMLSLYPTTDFQANLTANLSAEFYCSAQMFRDIFLLTCPAFYFSYAMAQKCDSDTTTTTTTNTTITSDCPEVFIYNHNKAILDAYLDSIGDPGLGVIHTSDLSYIYGNLSLFNISSAFDPSETDYLLERQMSRSWSSFASTGRPSLGANYTTLPGWEPSYAPGDAMMGASIYVSGGPEEGMSALEGTGASDGVVWQKLKERCGFLNSEVVIKQLEY